MKNLVLLAFAASPLSEALGLAPRKPDPRVARLEIERRHVSDPAARDRLRRRQETDDTVQVTLDNQQTLYYANISIGTPPQLMRTHIDTGSSDLWVNVPTSEYCESGGAICAYARTYDNSSSSSYNFVNSRFNISYVDGSGASGDYVSDVVRIGGASITEQQFGLGLVSSSSEGILGIGYPINEAQVQRARGPIYDNIPVNMVEQGFINTNAYSLWLNDLDASRGSILFGGVNSAKFEGTLATLPIIPYEVGGDTVYIELIIALTSMGTDSDPEQITFSQPQPVLLDSGSSLTYLPDDLTQNIFNAVNAKYDAQQRVAFVDCSLGNADDHLHFTFSNVTIRVPLNELVIRAGTFRGQPLCIFGVAPAGDGSSVLGDTFLRSAYVVYDLANNEISLAQTNFNATEDDIQEIMAGTGGVPDSTDVPNAVMATLAYGGAGGRTGGIPDVTGEGAPLPTTAAAPHTAAASLYGAAAAAAAAVVGLLFAL